MNRNIVTTTNPNPNPNPKQPNKTKHLFTYIWDLYVQIVYFFMTVYKMHFSPIVKIDLRQPVLSSMDLYIKLQTDRFLKSYECADNKTLLNMNIDKCFYSKKELHMLMQDSTNNIEPEWKRRILFESTPRGNVIMFYDSYKQGFAYYSDVNCIPYPLLNAVAMKYVLYYSCRDFFVDNKVTPVNLHSPLILEDQPEKKESNTRKNDFKDAPFAKLKNYNKMAPTGSSSRNVSDGTGMSGEDGNGAADNIPEVKKEYNNNKFISLGKMSNFIFLQSSSNKKTSSINGFASKLLDNLSGETKLQKDVMNYKDYKSKMVKENKT